MAADAMSSARPGRILVLGGGGQLGRALRATFPDAEFAARDDFDISNPASYESRPWQDYDLVINAAAYTAVDRAETPEGRRDAWACNVSALALLARVCTEHDVTLVHISSDYVFDGSSQVPYTETDPIAPLGTYGQTKAAGDVVVSTVPKHYIVRTSWVVGDGPNFVRAMIGLAERGIRPSVVDDQIGRPTFTVELSDGIAHLVRAEAPYGVYNITGGGEPASWAEVAKHAYALAGFDPESITGISTEEYFSGKVDIAPRPKWSVLDLAKVASTGFAPSDWREGLSAYLAGEKESAVA